MRLVLDTNVCLDLFVFADPRSAALHDALLARRCTAVSNEACRAEWQRVLRYPVLTLDSARCDALEADYDALVESVAAAERGVAAAKSLPRCKDTDDQKFLELARDAGAVALLTRDAALLELSPRTARAGLFDILTPEAWLRSRSLP